MPYLAAGAETVYTAFYKCLQKKDLKYRNIISKFIEKNDTGYLFSIGNELSFKSKDKIKDSLGRSFAKFFENKVFNEVNSIYKITNLTMDSGGYQAQLGYLSHKDCYVLIDVYKKFIETYHEKFRYFFTLDLAPPGLTYDEMLKLNETSLYSLSTLPEHIRKKIIFVYQFFTPKIHEIWKILTKKYFDKFSDYFAFGGIAAKYSGNIDIPISVFAIGISKILFNAKLHNLKKINIHILGSAAYRDIMLYQLYKVIIKKYHNIELDITYDSSLAFKQIQKSRRMNVIEKDFTNNLISLKENNLNKYVDRIIQYVDLTDTAKNIVLEKFLSMVEDVAPEYANFVKNMQIYEPSADGTKNILSFDFNILSVLFASYQYNNLEKQCYQYIQDRAYLLDKNEFEFYDVMNDVLLKLNAGKLSYQFKNKVKYYRSTIECLRDLDSDYVDDVVNTYLSQAEIVDRVSYADNLPLITF